MTSQDGPSSLLQGCNGLVDDPTTPLQGCNDLTGRPGDPVAGVLSINFLLITHQITVAMSTETQLNTAWLAELSNPHHDGTTQQIDDFAQAFVTDNQVFIQKRTALHQCRQTEDEVWLTSQRDPVVPRLAEADRQLRHRRLNIAPLGQIERIERIKERRILQFSNS